MGAIVRDPPEKRIPRMRTARNVVKELKKLDPDSDVSEYCIRRLIQNGDLPVVWAASKALVNLDDVLDLLRIGTDPVEPEPDEAEEPVTYGGIRRVAV